MSREDWSFYKNKDGEIEYNKICLKCANFMKSCKTPISHKAQITWCKKYEKVKKYCKLDRRSMFMDSNVNLREKCKFKDVCTSIYCDICDCLNCVTECGWDDDCPTENRS